MVFVFDILMDDIVCKASKREPSARKKNFDFVSR